MPLLLGEYLGEDLLLTLPHRQFVRTIPKDIPVFLPLGGPLHRQVGALCRRRAWARLQAKVHRLDVRACPRC